MNYRYLTTGYFYFGVTLLGIIQTPAFAGPDPESSEFSHYCAVSSQFADLGFCTIDEKDLDASDAFASVEALSAALDEAPELSAQAVTISVAVPVENIEDLDQKEPAISDQIHARIQATSPATKSLVAAKGATFISALLTYPMDLLKIRKQSSTLEAGRLYKGFLPFTAAFCPNIILNLAIYDSFKENGRNPFVAGVGSGYLSGIISNPMWVYRIHKSLETPEKPYSVRAYMKDLKADWRLGFRGQAINLPHSLGNGAFFLAFNQLNQQIKKQCADSDISVSSEAIAGGTARVLVNTVTYPMDTVRIIRQKTGQPYSLIWKGLIEETKTLAAQNIPGSCVRPFCKGFGWATGRMAAGATIYMHLHNEFKDLMGYSGPDSRN